MLLVEWPLVEVLVNIMDSFPKFFDSWSESSKKTRTVKK